MPQLLIVLVLSLGTFGISKNIEFIWKSNMSFKATGCMDYLEDAVTHCKKGNVDGLHSNLGNFYEQCVIDDEYTPDNLEQRIQAHAHWIEKSVVPECN